MIITIKDESFSGQVIHELSLDMQSESTTVREIISARVREEVRLYNERLPEYFKGLVKPSEAEQSINGYKLKRPKPIDSEKQVYIALDAFQKNGFFVLIDTLQSESLDQQVMLHENTEISFIKLTPLVGG